MLSDVISIFEKKYKEIGERLITDSYIPDDGEYIIVAPIADGFQILDRIEIKFEKKTGQIDKTNQYYDFICQADYMSKYLDSNKAISNKNIHSNNYLTFFVKKENIHNGKINKEIIDKYYDILKNPLTKSKYKESKTKALYKSFEMKNGKPDIKTIDKIRNWVKDNLFDLVQQETKDKSYLKIFFKYDLELYKKESERYIVVNIFNSNDYNIKINDKIYGLPNNNMGLNSKKPYLENKSRKISIPYLISEQDVIIQKKFFDYLANQLAINKTNIFINEENISALTNDEILDNDFTGYFLRIKKGTEVEIHDFDTVNSYKAKISPVNFQNYINVEKTNTHYGEIHSLDKLKNLINELFFSKLLSTNYFTEAKDLKINDSVLKKNLLLTRTILFAWFYKGIGTNVWKVLNPSSLDLIKNSINNGKITKASEQFNLRWSLKIYFEGGEGMTDILADIKNLLRKKINKDITDSIESDSEYFFAVGQVVSYFISLSKTKNKVHSLANPIINSRTDKRIKEQLRQLYKKYNYSINTNSNRFRNLYAMILAYTPKEKINEDLIIAGYLHSNLIYEKNDKEDNKNE